MPNVPNLPRVTEKDDGTRNRRMTEILSAFWSSLTRQKIILLVEGNQYRLRSGGAFSEPNAPGVDDDITIGATPGTVWIHEKLVIATSDVYVCITNTAGAAVWKLVS